MPYLHSIEHLRAGRVIIGYAAYECTRACAAQVTTVHSWCMLIVVPRWPKFLLHLDSASKDTTDVRGRFTLVPCVRSKPAFFSSFLLRSTRKKARSVRAREKMLSPLRKSPVFVFFASRATDGSRQEEEKEFSCIYTPFPQPSARLLLPDSRAHVERSVRSSIFRNSSLNPALITTATQLCAVTYDINT